MTTATTPAVREASPVTVQANLARVVMETITTTALARVASPDLMADPASRARAATTMTTALLPLVNGTLPCRRLTAPPTPGLHPPPHHARTTTLAREASPAPTEEKEASLARTDTASRARAVTASQA